MSLRARLRRPSRTEPSRYADISPQRPERDPQPLAQTAHEARRAELERQFAAEYAAAIAAWREWDHEPAWHYLDRFNPCP